MADQIKMSAAERFLASRAKAPSSRHIGPRAPRGPAAEELVDTGTRAGRRRQLTEQEVRRAEQIARGRLQRSTEHNDALKARYRALGAMPIEPLAAVDHTLRILQISVDETLEDETLSAKERRAEVRQIARAMIPMLPVARLYKAERHIRGAADQVARDRRDPLVSPAPDGEASLRMDS